MGALTLVAVVLVGTASIRPAAARPTTYGDPIPYCRAIGTIDRPDGRYTGPAVPAWMARALRRALLAPPEAPITAFQHGVWRCSQGRVMACSFGANIPCDDKADQGRTPQEGARDFCAQRPGADVVPSVAFARPSIYLWRCNGSEPVVARQVLQVDRDGYPAEFWHAVAP